MRLQDEFAHIAERMCADPRRLKIDHPELAGEATESDVLALMMADFREILTMLWRVVEEVDKLNTSSSRGHRRVHHTSKPGNPDTPDPHG